MRWALAGAACLVPVAAQAGGWTQAPEAFYARVVNRIIAGERGYDRHGDGQDTGGRFTDWQLQLYGEYGLTEALTLVAFATPAGHARFEDGQRASEPGRIAGSTFYTGPIGLGARYGKPVGPLRLAVEGRYGYAPPVGEEAVGAGRFVCDAAPCERFTYAPGFSHHRFDGEVQAGLGLPAGLWLSVAAGMQAFAGADLDPAVTGLAQLGWAGPWGLVVEMHFTLHHPLGTLTENQISGTGATRYVGNGLGLSWWFSPHVALTGGIDGAFLAESNAAAASTTIGVELK